MAIGLTYDTGALMAAERNNRAMWALHRAAVDRSISITVPAGVLGEAWRGGPQAQLSRLLAACDVEALTEPRARAIGALARLSQLHDTVGLAVAEGAMRRDDAVVTSNRSHIERAVGAMHRTIEIHDT
jgi:hypothetical protein